MEVVVKMDYSEIIMSVGCTLILLLILYRILELLFYVISGEFLKEREQEKKLKVQKEKVFHLKKTSYRRGIR
ncbi:hypothetical protein [Escherichia coli]|uniref:hypothetical protein n=2 Tax=Bacteria TaxID=2 RepID=UPI000E2F7B22|nr:hypothetical protein [Escherichia coli]